MVVDSGVLEALFSLPPELQAANASASSAASEQSEPSDLTSHHQSTMKNGEEVPSPPPFRK